MASVERQGRGLIILPSGGGVVAAAATAPAVVPLPIPIPPPPAPAIVGLVGAPAAPHRTKIAGAGDTWIHDEPAGRYQMGQEVILPANAVDFGSESSVTVGREVVSVTYVGASTNLSRHVAFSRHRRSCDTLGGRGAVTLAGAEHFMSERTAMLMVDGIHRCNGS